MCLASSLLLRLLYKGEPTYQPVLPIILLIVMQRRTVSQRAMQNEAKIFGLGVLEHWSP